MREEPGLPMLLRFVFTTPSGLFLLALFVVPPIVFTLISSRTIRPLHFKINLALAIVFVVPAWKLLSLVERDSGFAGAVLVVSGMGLGFLALSFLVATIATSVVLLMRDGRRAAAPRTKATPMAGRGPSKPPLQESFDQWKIDNRRPRASYQEFLDEAHPRYFPASARALIIAVVLMALVWFLILRQ
jgi:hypothetical protein